jgi:hypothetical protein
MALPKNLDGDSLPRCREHSNILVETLELGILWDEYGLVGDVVVHTYFYTLFIGPYLRATPPALHGGFSTCRYPRAVSTRHSPSAYQRDF